MALLLTACATPYIRPAGPDTMAPALYQDHAVMADGYVLPVSVWRPLPGTTVRAVVLGLHGLNDYRRAFDAVGPPLAARGIVTYAYDQRGFGATQAAGMWHGAGRLAEDMRAMAKLVRAAYPGLPLYAMGESLGGAVLLSTLQGTAPDIDGMILVAPAVWARSTMPLLQRISLWLGAHTMPADTVTGGFLHIWPSDNRAMLRKLHDDPLMIKATRIDVLYGTAQVMDQAYAAAPKLLMPALILYGQHDQIIPKQPVCDMLERLPSGKQRRWRMAYYPDGYHMLTRDLDGDTVMADITAWILNPRAPLPSGDEILTGSRSRAPFCRSRPAKIKPYIDSH
ncbi:MAG: alpha/beta fold hydrolase [Gammaproteobacteria bacterium]|jgi:acylglycerol lipase